MIQIPQANNTAITIYSYWKDPIADLATYKRTFIERSHFDPVSVSNKNKFGNVIMLDARLRIFDVSKFKTFSEFQKLPFNQISEYWTLNPGTPTSRDQSYILLGDIPYEFAPGTVASITTQETAFKKQHNYDNYRAELVDPKFDGSPRMRHVAVSLKRTV